jgi:hypothetical protein
MSSQTQLREYLPHEDRIVLATSFQEKHQPSLPGMTAKQFVASVVDRFWTEISRTIYGRNQSIQDSDIGPAYQKWTDDQVWLAAENNIPVPVVSADQCLALRNLIVQEVADRAAYLFSRWKGNTYPPIHHDGELFLRTSLWNKLAPNVPENVKSMCITANSSEDAEEIVGLIIQITRKTASKNDKIVNAEFELEDFPVIWEMCKLRHIPNTSLTFS